MDYSKKAYSFLKLKGKIWESEFAHFSIGLKAFEKIKKKNPKVLDVGCGAGSLTTLWQEKFPNFKFFGIDISTKAISLAKKNKSNIKFRLCSAEDITKLKSTFDAISICEVIEHVNNPSEVLLKINKILNKGGIMYLTTQLEKDKRTLIGKYFKNKDELPKERIAGHIQVFDKNSITKLIRKSGFKIIEIYYNCHLLGQIEDFLYVMYLRNKKKEVLTFTNYLQKKGGLTWYLGIYAMRVIASIRNIQTILQRRKVGLGIQIIAVKK